MEKNKMKLLQYILSNGGNGAFINIENYTGFQNNHENDSEFQKAVHQLKNDKLIDVSMGQFLYPVSANEEVYKNYIYEGDLHAKISLKGEEKLQSEKFKWIPIVITLLILLFGVLNYFK